MSMLIYIPVAVQSLVEHLEWFLYLLFNYQSPVLTKNEWGILLDLWKSIMEKILDQMICLLTSGKKLALFVVARLGHNG